MMQVNSPEQGKGARPQLLAQRSTPGPLGLSLLAAPSLEETCTARGLTAAFAPCHIK